MKKKFKDIYVFLVRRLVFLLLVFIIFIFGCSKNPEDYIKAGIIKYTNGEYKLAAIDFNKALELDNKNVKARKYLGLCLFSSGNYPASIIEFSKYLEKSPDDKEIKDKIINAYKRSIEIYKTNNSYNQIIDNLKQLINIDKNNTDYYFDICNIYINYLNTPEKSFEYASYLVKNLPKSSKAHFLLGRSLIGKNQIDQALKEFEIAIKLEPENMDAHSALIYIYRELKKQPEKSLKLATDLVKKFPKNAMAYNILGIEYHQRAYFKITKKDLNELKEENINQEIIKSLNSLIDKKFNTTEEFEKNLPLKLSNIEKKLILRKARKSDKIDQSLSQYKKALELDPKLAKTYRNLASVYAEKEQKDKAIENYQKYLTFLPDAPDKEQIKNFINNLQR